MIWWETINNSKSQSLLYLSLVFPTILIHKSGNVPQNRNGPRQKWAVHFPGMPGSLWMWYSCAPCLLGTTAASHLGPLQANTRLQSKLAGDLCIPPRKILHLSCCAHGPKPRHRDHLPSPSYSVAQKEKETSILKLYLHSVAKVGAKEYNLQLLNARGNYQTGSIWEEENLFLHLLGSGRDCVNQSNKRQCRNISTAAYHTYSHRYPVTQKGG